jgi:AraC family transcriptional regulator
VDVFPQGYFERFDPMKEFEKWAAVRVEGEHALLDGWEKLVVLGGDYAVFIYRGLPSAAGPFFQAIYGENLPKAGLMVDHRPHFAIMGEQYKGEHPESEEEIWIPVKRAEIPS